MSIFLFISSCENSHLLINSLNFSIEENFTITADSEIRIYFNETQTSIEHFFDSEYDPNVENITQVDVSYLISENLIQTNSLFKGCISLAKENIITKDNKILEKLNN